MGKVKGLALCLGVCFVFTVAALPARADSICADDMVAKLKHAEDHLNLPDVGRAGTGVLSFTEHFENDSGRHVGFSVASTHGRGQKFGLFKKEPQPGGGGDTTPNPEPAAVFLLGTGLAAVGAYARKRFRKSDR
jgi:hypothetical protein